MNLGVRLWLASGFILDAMPGWEEPMLLETGTLNEGRENRIARAGALAEWRALAA